MGARLIATRPGEGGTAAPSAAVVAVFSLGDGWSPSDLQVRVRLDGEDVTEGCSLRADRASPPRRAELVLVGVGPGPHLIELEWPGASPHSWHFSVAAD